ncbi:alcohol dehydrogenase [Brevibacterium jeotgali]|uniref:Alcohol dehydrogenase, propanol-preferring n=1 Tax=Brevibacterium jeotgali TaxID=1262550 RepID=A0A2H1L7G8_9MICO|nr:alcohol dehydrogenase [Brevibacterium jeotgali]TWC02268.1 alcohol dehydrogenase/propanol-preferring alcohol dehydrogenase [Brevibacterium jeotgali]SMY12680.1 alcohol dehydrogenase, propanol-preferring [Brevibacterium jeotgali]
MKVFAAPGPDAPFEEMEVESPTPTGRQVLLRVTHSGVCHTDTHSHSGQYDLGGGASLSIADRGLEYPAVFGHEIVGEVIAVGPDAADVTAGDSRIVFPWVGCGTCGRCAAGHSNLCRTSEATGVFRWGGFATEVLIRDSDFLVDYEGLDPSWAATLACSGLTSFSAVNRILPLDEDETVAVIGTGGVGLAAIALLSRMTSSRIVAVDVNDANLESAAGLGAHVTVNSRNLGATSLAEHLGGPVQAIVDFVNSSDTFTFAFASIDKGGTIVPVGLFGGSAQVSTALLPLKAVSVIGNYVGNLTDLRTLVEMAKTQDLPKVPIIERPFTLADTTDSLAELTAGTATGRTVLVG